jgi:hypothetical protein
MTFFSMVLSLLFLLELFLVHPTTAALVNRTIDDQYGDSVTKFMPIYSSQSWSQGNGSGSSLNVDPSARTPLLRPTKISLTFFPAQANDLTWHYIAVAPESNATVQSITLNFTGEFVE